MPYFLDIIIFVQGFDAVREIAEDEGPFDFLRGLRIVIMIGVVVDADLIRAVE